MNLQSKGIPHDRIPKRSHVSILWVLISTCYIVDTCWYRRFGRLLFIFFWGTGASCWLKGGLKGFDETFSRYRIHKLLGTWEREGMSILLALKARWNDRNWLMLSLGPRLPNTWWGGIWTPKTYLKHLLRRYTRVIYEIIFRSRCLLFLQDSHVFEARIQNDSRKTQRINQWTVKPPLTIVIIYKYIHFFATKSPQHRKERKGTPFGTQTNQPATQGNAAVSFQLPTSWGSSKGGGLFGMFSGHWDPQVVDMKKVEKCFGSPHHVSLLG